MDRLGRLLASVVFSVPLLHATALRALALPQASTPTCSIAQGYQGPQGGSATGPSIATTCLVLQAYVEAYNRHDLAATLSLLAATSPSIADCDFVRDRDYRFTGRGLVMRWLRDRFAENDRLDVSIVIGGWIGDTPSPRVFAFHGTRTNDLLTAQGLPPQSLDASKGIVDQSGQRVQYYVIGDPNHCAQRHLPSGASAARTQTITRAFLDAYNAGDLHRVLQLVTRTVHYSDCDYTLRRYVTISAKAQFRRWLQARFRQHDRFTDIQIMTDNPDQPYVASVVATRTSDAITARGFPSLPAGYKIVLAGPRYTTIQRAVTPAPGDRCTV